MFTQVMKPDNVVLRVLENSIIQTTASVRVYMLWRPLDMQPFFSFSKNAFVSCNPRSRHLIAQWKLMYLVVLGVGHRKGHFYLRLCSNAPWLDLLVRVMLAQSSNTAVLVQLGAVLSAAVGSVLCFHPRETKENCSLQEPRSRDTGP